MLFLIESKSVQHISCLELFGKQSKQFFILNRHDHFITWTIAVVIMIRLGEVK